MNILILITMISFFCPWAQSSNRIDFDKIYKKNSLIVDQLIENTVLINVTREESASGLNRGSGFYIGYRNGQHLFITNAHVMDGSKECKSASISLLNKSMDRYFAPCEKVIFSHYESKQTDITVFTIEEKYVKQMIGTGLLIDWNFVPTTHTMVAHTGFGATGMTSQSSTDLQKKLKRFNMHLVIGETCKITSPTNAYGAIEKLKIEDFFSTGCHALEGDSGSPMIDLQTGRVIGLVFGGTFKNADLKHIDQWIQNNDPKAWDTGTAAISLTKIKRFFQEHALAD